MPKNQLVFTMRSIRVHIFPETGLYTVIEGAVYDLSEYADAHPGGRELVYRSAGRDSTTDFINSHPNNWRQYLADIQHLRVGHMVPERGPDDAIGSNEIVLLNWVYKMNLLAEINSPPIQRLYARLQAGLVRYYGQEVTQLYLSAGSSAAVFQPLLDLPQIVIAHVDRGIMAEIAPAELAENATLRVPALPQPGNSILLGCRSFCAFERAVFGRQFQIRDFFYGRLYQI